MQDTLHGTRQISTTSLFYTQHNHLSLILDAYCIINLYLSGTVKALAYYMQLPSHRWGLHRIITHLSYTFQLHPRPILPKSLRPILHSSILLAHLPLLHKVLHSRTSSSAKLPFSDLKPPEELEPIGRHLLEDRQRSTNVGVQLSNVMARP